MWRFLCTISCRFFMVVFLLEFLQVAEDAWGSLVSTSGFFRFQEESLRGRGRSGYLGYSFLISCLSYLSRQPNLEFYCYTFSLLRSFILHFFVVLL